MLLPTTCCANFWSIWKCKLCTTTYCNIYCILSQNFSFLCFQMLREVIAKTTFVSTLTKPKNAQIEDCISTAATIKRGCSNPRNIYVTPWIYSLRIISLININVCFMLLPIVEGRHEHLLVYNNIFKHQAHQQQQPFQCWLTFMLQKKKNWFLKV